MILNSSSRLITGGIYKSHSYDALITDAGKYLPLVDLKIIFPHMRNIFETRIAALARAKQYIDTLNIKEPGVREIVIKILMVEMEYKYKDKTRSVLDLMSDEELLSMYVLCMS